eukprot:2087305-Heterocapsa_arctica.AAC.1
MGDYEVSKYLNRTNKRKEGRIFKDEQEEGTRITSINLSGSTGWQTMAHLKGWQGVWETAKVNEKDKDGVTGRSGG